MKPNIVLLGSPIKFSNRFELFILLEINRSLETKTYDFERGQFLVAIHNLWIASLEQKFMEICLTPSLPNTLGPVQARIATEPLTIYNALEQPIKMSKFSVDIFLVYSDTSIVILDSAFAFDNVEHISNKLEQLSQL